MNTLSHHDHLCGRAESRPRRLAEHSRQSFKRIVISLGLAGLIIASMNDVSASTILVDDFNDGNATGWSCPFLSTCDASSFAYELQSTNLVDPPQGVGAFWSPSKAPLYNNGLLRARVRNDASGTVAGVTMRNSPESAYFFMADSRRSIFYMQKKGMAPQTVSGLSFNAGEEWIIEGGIVGDQLSMKVWREGTPEPANPQLVTTDPQPLKFDEFGVLSFVRAGAPDRIDATFDDIYFTHIPPSGILEDFDGDGEVNFADFLQFSAAFGGTSMDERVLFDLDASGKVDFADFLRFSGRFGQTANVAAVPEPSGFILGFGFLGLLHSFRVRARARLEGSRSGSRKESDDV